MKNKGQSIVEFVIITAVVVLGGIFTLTALGGNINEMFSSSLYKQKNFNPFNVKNQKPANTSTIIIDSDFNEDNDIVETKVIGNYSVDMLDDGSAILSVNGKDITLSAASLASMDTIMQTTGAEGDLIDIVGYMLETHAAEYPDTNIPIEISFGDGTRYTDPVGDGTFSYAFTGEASVNTVSVRVDDHLVILQNDQKLDIITSYGADDNDEYTEMAVNRIEGNISTDGQTFNAIITSDNTSLNGKDFTASVTKTPDGFNFVDNDLTYTEMMGTPSEQDESGGKWEFNFITGNDV